jgi:hypothetical protein
MRRTLWTIPLLLMVITILLPCARADSVTFSCTGDNNNENPTPPPFYGPCLVAAPTAPDVTFPGPTLVVTWFSQTFDIALTSTWLDSDSYSWLASNSSFIIFDNTQSGLSVYAYPINTNLSIGGGAVQGLSEFGTLTFTPGTVPAPEPGTGFLMLLGVGLVLVMGKHIASSLLNAHLPVVGRVA